MDLRQVVSQNYLCVGFNLHYLLGHRFCSRCYSSSFRGMKYLYLLLYLTGVLDWWSTIIQGDWTVEENPVARWAWHYGGDLGLLAQRLVFTGIFILICHLLIKYNPSLKIIAVLMSLLFLAVTVLIAFTNLNWIGYEWTAWLTY